MMLGMYMNLVLKNVTAEIKNLQLRNNVLYLRKSVNRTSNIDSIIRRKL